MKYDVYISEYGFGICSEPEHHLGVKTIYHEVFYDKQIAMDKASAIVKDLYDKYEICREWKVISDNELKWIETKSEDICGWTHYYSAYVYEWTDAEYEKIEKEGIA